MKIICKIEKSGTPVLFFPDDKNGIYIGCYAHMGQHADCSRAYMRSCKNPESESELAAVYKLLIEWASL